MVKLARAWRFESSPGHQHCYDVREAYVAYNARQEKTRTPEQMFSVSENCEAVPRPNANDR